MAAVDPVLTMRMLEPNTETTWVFLVRLTQ